MYIKTENLHPDYGHVLHSINAKKGATFLIENIVLDNLILMDAETIAGTGMLDTPQGMHALTLQFNRKLFKQLRAVLHIKQKKFLKYFGKRHSYPGPFFQMQSKAILFKSITVLLAKHEKSLTTGELFIPVNIVSPSNNQNLEYEIIPKAIYANIEDKDREGRGLDWLVDQYIAWKMDLMEEKAIVILNEFDPEWKNVAAHEIAGGQLSRIVHEIYSEDYEVGLPPEWSSVLKIIQSKVKDDIQKYDDLSEALS
ncbi:MAG: hypothetical protein R8K22_07905 [Mariprofundaceae bacterium]